MRPVRVTDTALGDVATQLSADRAALFVRHDLGPALDRLAEVDDWHAVSQPNDGPGRRVDIAGITVGGYHLFADVDPFESSGLVVFEVRIWPEEWPRG